MEAEAQEAAQSGEALPLGACAELPVHPELSAYLMICFVNVRYFSERGWFHPRRLAAVAEQLDGLPWTGEASRQALPRGRVGASSHLRGTSICEQLDTVDEARGVGREEQRGLGDFPWVRDPSQRNGTGEGIDNPLPWSEGTSRGVRAFLLRQDSAH